MELKYIVSAALGISGGALALKGFLDVNQSYINLGIAGMFLAAVILTLKSSEYVKKESLEVLLNSQKGLLKSLLSNLRLDGKAVYLPPYENLPWGGIFVPLHEDFDLDPARLDEETFFLTDTPDEKSMGLLMTSLGTALLEKYEEHLEAPISSVPELEASAGSVLKALGLASRVHIEENEDEIRVVITPEISCSPDECEKAPCPLCASVLLGLAKATDNLIGVESFEKKDYGVEIRARKLGGVEEWM
ncbi:MAG TPA: hypothetical protein ENH81_06385 [Thermococcus sp.]|nr:hypothetical protein [Thermococcus sp.]